MHLTAELNKGAERAELEKEFEEVWNPEEFAKEFKAINFYAPFVFVQRGNVFGTVLFQHYPRYYFHWREQEVSQSVAESVLEVVTIDPDD
jgi:hypothetical protein